jgi:hypothetical protein
MSSAVLRLRGGAGELSGGVPESALERAKTGPESLEIRRVKPYRVKKVRISF